MITDPVAAEANADYESWRRGFPGPPYPVREKATQDREPVLVGDALNDFLDSFVAAADREADRFEAQH